MLPVEMRMCLHFGPVTDARSNTGRDEVRLLAEAVLTLLQDRMDAQL